jgi:pimeloyl-ACP methyl ester carboxylesterase
MPALMKDELFEAQLLRSLGYAAYGGADIGECLAVAGRIDRVDPLQWYEQWFALGEQLEAAAVRSIESAQRVSARESFLRASNYFRTAGVFLIGAPIDERVRESHRREVTAFRHGAALLDSPPEVVEIPYEGSTLPAYFFRCRDDGGRRPVVVLTTGYDGSAEELYFASGAAALARGYHVLAFEGPGQGSMILDRGIAVRPDWEAVVTPVVDWLTGHSEVDSQQIVLSGLSLGGYLAPRAATAEHRLAACVSDCGPYDVFDAAASRLPGFLARQLPDGRPSLLRLLARVLRVVMRKPTAGWALRRNVLVHGVEDPLEFFRLAPQYSLKGREAAIACPTFVCTTDRDDLSVAAPALYEALTCPKQLVRFASADGAGDHCEAAARVRVNATVFDWLATVLPAGITGSAPATHDPAKELSR